MNLLFLLKVNKQEAKRHEEKIGTTGRGIGPCYTDKIARMGIRVIDLLSREKLAKKIIKKKWDEIIPRHGLNVEEVIDTYAKFGEQIKPFVIDSSLFINKAIDENKKISWKKNYYSKNEKKLNPILSLSLVNNNLIVADNVSKIFSINSNSGDLIWSNKSDYPFNSEIKIKDNKFFVVDYKNILRCFYLNDGSECWNVQTEDSFTVSKSKFSLIIKDNLIIFNNSIGDITAVDISSGLIQWQLPTQKSTITNETYNFNYSKLISDGNSIYFSNNKDQFYSVDLKTGTTNWINEINSILTPIIVDDFIFTVSKSGHLFTLQNKQGNIIKINNLYKNYDQKKRKNLKPTGFSIGSNKLYLSNSDGSLIIINLNSGDVLKAEKVARNFISKPYIQGGNLFVVKNGSIIQYD